MKKRLKILMTLIGIIIVLIFILISLNQFSKEKYDIKNRIGAIVPMANMTMNEYITLSDGTIKVYLKFLQNHEYEKAYSLLSPYYKEIVSYEVFEGNMKILDFSDYYIAQIVHETENMYIVDVQLGDSINKMLVLIGEKGFHIVPEPFLKYYSMNQKITKNGIEYELIGYQINVDSCIFDLKISNNSKKDAVLDSKIFLSSSYSIDAENGAITVKAGNIEPVSLKFNTHIEFPSKLQLIRKDEKKERIYEFKLD